jgi:flagellar biosynthetic protein FlhB
MFSVFAVFGTSIVQNTGKMLTEMFSGGFIQDTVTINSVSIVFRSALRYFFIIVAPLFIAAFLSAVAFNLIQVGFLFSAKAIQPKLDKISMVQGFKRMFSGRTVIELLKSIAKVSIIAIVGYGAYKTEFAKMPELMGENVFIGAQQAVKIILAVAYKIVIVLAIFAPLDYVFQWWKYNKDL